MGGKIFQQGANALSTPRMPRAVYMHMLQKVHGILDGLDGTTRVEDHKTPISAPGKPLYGDVDVLVFKTLAAEDFKNGKPDFRPFLMQLQDAFGAVRKVRTTDEHTASYAIPWPAGYNVPPQEDKDKEKLPEALQNLSLEPKNHFVQVDVKVTHSRMLFDYTYLMDSHSGPFTFLGGSLERFCLSAGPRGLRLRVQEMKAAGQQKNNSVDLTSDPKEICNIVGWDYDRLVDPAGFATTQEMFRFIASSKYFLPISEKSVDEKAADPSASSSKARKRLEREIYRQWVEDFLPTTMHNPAYQRKIPDSAKIREELFQMYPEARIAYQDKLEKFLAKRRDERIRAVIKEALPAAAGTGVEDNLRKFAEAGFKQLLVGSSDPDVVMRSKATDYPLPALPNTECKTMSDEAIRRFVKQHWKEVGLWKMWVAPCEAEAAICNGA